MHNDDKLTKYFSEALTDLEKEKIEGFCKDEVLSGAIRKVILQGIYVQGTIQKGFEVDPLVNGAFSLASLSVQNPIPNEQLGEHIKAMWMGVNYVKNAFDSLVTIKKTVTEPVESPYNPAI